MSRYILTRWPDGQARLVVGYDHAIAVPGAFFQEFAQEPPGDPDDWPPGWQEVLRDGGIMRGIPIGALIDSMPDDLKGYVTADVIERLHYDEQDLDSGYGSPTMS